MSSRRSNRDVVVSFVQKQGTVIWRLLDANKPPSELVSTIRIIHVPSGVTSEDVLGLVQTRYHGGSLDLSGLPSFAPGARRCIILTWQQLGDLTC